MTDLLYRIVGLEDWDIAQRQGHVPRCGSDERDGFVHLSTAETYLETADLYFVPAEDPVVLEIDAQALGSALRWEAVETRGGTQFPHLYAPGIPLAAVRGVIRLEHGPAGFRKGRRLPPTSPSLGQLT